MNSRKRKQDENQKKKELREKQLEELKIFQKLEEMMSKDKEG